jgi:ATP-binding cassette subfamily B protein
VRNTIRTFKVVWKEWPALVVGILLASIVLAVVPFATSAARAYVIDELIRIAGSGVLTQTLAVGIVFLVVSSLVPALFDVIARYLSKMFWFQADAKFEMDLMRKAADVDIAAYETPKYNDLFTRVKENGVWRLQNFTERQFNVLQDIVQVVTATLILGLFKWWLVLVLLAGTLPELLVQIRYGKNVWGIYGAKAEVKRRYWSLRKHFDRDEAITELKLFQSTRYFVEKIRTLFLQFQTEQRTLEKKKLRLEIVATIVSQVAVLIAIWWAVVQVVDGVILVGVFTFLLASVGDFRSALSSFFGNMARQFEDSLFVTDIFTVLDLPKLLPQPHPGVLIAKNRTPEIVFENVSFAYPTNDIPVLKHINLRIAPGTKLALVGVNGAGKTTFVKLLCRFYDPTEGRILINGTDLREINVDSWYKQLGILFQEYNHYNLEVKDSIAAGDASKRPSLARVREAARNSEADSFIESWPKKYEQILGKEFTNGLDPSIGQWQKLALARVFYRDPKVFVLDEPTASIDAEAEAHIFERLEKLAQNKTVILISHRFSTVRKADQICVIKDGAMHEQGSHEELLRKDGTYAKLFRLQAKGYE